MIVLLSPAKTLDEGPSDVKKHSQIRFAEESDKLIKVLRKQSLKNLKSLMNISDNLAKLNADRYITYDRPFTFDNAKQAILAFKGDVYQGLEADTLEDEDLDYAQDHIRILSGLYGVLRPLDMMHPYRLEMGTSLKVGRAKNLYEFWGSQITTLINSDLESAKSDSILNLASQEYFKAIKPEELNGKLINVHFKEKRNGKYKVISFNAKKARGKMARQIIIEKIKTIEDLKSLKVYDYRYNADMSSDGELYFTID